MDGGFGLVAATTSRDMADFPAVGADGRRTEAMDPQV